MCDCLCLNTVSPFINLQCWSSVPTSLQQRGLFCWALAARLGSTECLWHTNLSVSGRIVGWYSGALGMLSDRPMQLMLGCSPGALHLRSTTAHQLPQLALNDTALKQLRHIAAPHG